MNKKLLMILCSGVFVFSFILKGMDREKSIPSSDEVVETDKNAGEVKDAATIKNLPLIASVIIDPKTGEIIDIENVQLPDDAMRKLINSNPNAAYLWRKISNKAGLEAFDLETKDIHNMSFSRALQVSGNGILKTLDGVGRMSFIVIDRYLIPFGKKAGPCVIKISKDTASYLKLCTLWSYRNGIQPGAHFITKKTPKGVRQFFNKYWRKAKDKSVKIWNDVAFQFN